MLQVMTAAAATTATTSWDVAETVAGWLGVKGLLGKPFCELSQGQQKLALIAAALASRPPLLVLDEPCQGLDMIHRQRVLTLVERICQATDISLVYITHHLEELLPSVTHALHLKERRDVYNGRIEEYRPEEL
jgi:ABC-type molybdenum transport system ATPase subunit/photorepair protein PhrA